MLVVYLLMSLLYYSGNCYEIEIQNQSYNDKLLKCITGIIQEYFTEGKVVTYVGNKIEDEELLRSIHNAIMVSVLSRQTSRKLARPHEAYLISARNASYFLEHFPLVTEEAGWNPLALFLIIMRKMKDGDLKLVFDMFLKLHAINVVVVNATEDAHLYSYNPYDNYNCGKRYDSIFSHGKCLSSLVYLYPEKTVTGLRNCTLDVMISHWPPYAIISNDSHNTSPYQNGTEPYLFQLIGDIQGFKVNVVYSYDTSEEFPTVSSDNMKAAGTLKKIQDNEVDAVLGGMLLIPSRAKAFSFIDGHLAYTDEIRFIVRRASLMAAWKNVYLEFDTTVWVLLIICLMLYSMLITILLRIEDKSYIVMWMIDSLVLHGRSIQCRLTVKYVLILWVWFAYLVNTFYQSSLVSLTANPIQEYQISSEEDINKFELQPCFSRIMGKYYIESVQSNDDYHFTDGCEGMIDSIKSVSKSKDLYSIILYGIYSYHRQNFYDEYGKPRIISVSKPYSKAIYAIYVEKGFPFIHSLRYNALQLRENGLVDKIMNDVNYLQKIKHIYREKPFKTRSFVPWRIYVIGCAIAVVTFAIEMITHHK